VSELDHRWRMAELKQRLSRVWMAAGGTPRLQSTPVEAEAEVRAEVDSTNTRLMEEARSDAAPGLRLLVAEAQTAGRGRRGRSWHAQPGASLCFSIALPLEAPSPSLSLAMAVAVAEALDPLAGTADDAAPRLMLKWPNDVWLRDVRSPGGGRKLGGLLIETVASPGGRVLVAGLGLNLRPLAMSEAADYGIATWSEVDRDCDAVSVLHTVAPAVLAALLGQTAHVWRKGWAQRDILAGRHIEAQASTGNQRGVACGIADDGSLLLRADDDGQIRAVTSGEVSIRALVSEAR
jgi:BirA family transcriptional regulator, biotin operon repressor / biotin---[acetyl-CoA-carboxylase] ligase